VGISVQNFTTTSAGLAGIMRKQKKKQLEENATTSTAFTGDLETLMDKAKDVIKIIERYSKKEYSSGGKTNDEDAEVQNLLDTIGVTNMGAEVSERSER